MDDELKPCPFCIGTGIGNPHVERSVCSACNGSGVHRTAREFVDEDRWAWNHFEPEPGDEDEQYKSWQQVSAGAADSHSAGVQAPINNHSEIPNRTVGVAPAQGEARAALKETK